MTDRLAELGALQYAVENLSTAGTNPNRLGLAGYIHAAYTDYQTWAAANPGVNPNRLSARGRLYGYFYDHASWSPLSLFASSEVGVWYDPSDLTTMFQDRAGTTPVTADGQTVGKILDKSGRGNHATAPSDAARPLYKTDGTYHWLQFDGVDDSLSTAAIDFTSVNKTGIFAGTYIVDSTNWRILAIQGASSQFNKPSVGLQIPAGSSAMQSVSFPSSAATYSSLPGGTTSINTKGVFSSLIDRSVSSRSVVNRRNGSEVNATGWAIESGFYGNNPLFISGAGGESYKGNIYSLIVRGALSTTQEITDTETWVAAKTGVTL